MIEIQAYLIAWNINFSLPHFLTISSNLALLQLSNLNLYMVSWGVNFSHKNGSIPLWLAPYMITSKSPPKSYKYDNYDKAAYKVSPYC